MGQVVEVISNSSGESLNIHRALILKHAPQHQLKDDLFSEEASNTFVTAPFSAIRTFAHWLYTDEGPVFGDQIHPREIEDALAAHGLGEAVGCVDFMDTVLDAIIHRMTSRSGIGCIDFVADIFRDRFKSGSGGYQFLVDYLTHCDWPGCGRRECSLAQEIDQLGDEELLTEVARATLRAQDFEVGQDVLKPEYCKMVISGSISLRGVEDLKVRGGKEFPWGNDRCQYHRHSELGLPCYEDEA